MTRAEVIGILEGLGAHTANLRRTMEFCRIASSADHRLSSMANIGGTMHCGVIAYAGTVSKDDPRRVATFGHRKWYVNEHDGQTWSTVASFAYAHTDELAVLEAALLLLVITKQTHAHNVNMWDRNRDLHKLGRIRELAREAHDKNFLEGRTYVDTLSIFEVLRDIWRPMSNEDVTDELQQRNRVHAARRR